MQSPPVRGRGLKQKYVSQDVVHAMLGEGGSSREELSIMHTNIVDFRRLTLGMTPEKMIEWLNRYFGSMSEIIEKNGGSSTSWRETR